MASDRPFYRLPMCWLKWCGGRVEADDNFIWWQCATCKRAADHTPRAKKDTK